MSETIITKYESGAPRSYGSYDPVHCYPQSNNHPFNPCNDKDYVSNGQFAKSDDTFKKACENAGVEATARQASKYRAKKGVAYLFSQQSTIDDVEEFKRELCRRGSA